jgi:RNA polymerase sigma factor (sigma-70 family)
MKIRYQFVNEAMDIEVEESWGSLLVDLDRSEYNNNQTETRRHISLSGLSFEGRFFSQEDDDLAALFTDDSEEQKLKKAITLLKPKQQELINAIYLEGMSVSEYALKEGVSQPAISQRLDTALKNLKKLL